MPIKPPDLDDRNYDDIVREARALIPQYCPDWTNLSDADPGMTLVQLFAWMTEMTIFRLNRVPDKTYVHFLNFIGEERRHANAATVPVTFTLRDEEGDAVEFGAFSRVSTRSGDGGSQVHFVTSDHVTVHSGITERVVAVHASPRPRVREISFVRDPETPAVLRLGGSAGLQPFVMDDVAHGPHAYTSHQYLYLAHDDFALMDFEVTAENPAGRMRLRTETETELPLAGLFRWERRTAEGWVPLDVVEESERVLGMPDITLVGHLPDQAPVEHFGVDDDPFPIPEPLNTERHWIRGAVDYERWLAQRMEEDLEIHWRDDRGGDERLISNWEVRATGRSIELFVQDMPPIRAGWTVKLTMVDRSMPAGRNAYFPRYRFSYRTQESWIEVPADRVRYQSTSILLTGPFADMAMDGYNLRAERIETVYLRAMMPNLEMKATWMRPVVVHLSSGSDVNAAFPIDPTTLPITPFQLGGPTIPPLVGMKFLIGSDLLDNRAQRGVLLELEVSFTLDGDPIEEPTTDYHLQLTYRTNTTWQVVHTDDGRFSRFTFADLDPEGARIPGRRRIAISLDPRSSLKGIHRAKLNDIESSWLRIEMTKADLSYAPDPQTPPQPISLVVHAVRLSVDGVTGKNAFEQPMPGLKAATVEYRDQNRRLSRAIVRSSGRLSEHHPFDTFIAIKDTLGTDDDPTEHTALYLKLSRPLPVGQRHAITFRTRGETFLPEDVDVIWEMLEDAGHGATRWRRLTSGEGSYTLARTGTLEFEMPEVIAPPPAAGTWLRALLRSENPLPAFPPISHIMLNTVEAVNLHEFRTERFNGLGTPNQVIQLRRFPLYLHPDEGDNVFAHPDRFADIRVTVREDDGARREWRRAVGNTLLMASKDDRVFVVDPVEGTLTFGNGIRGRMLPVGNFNVSVEVYHAVPGSDGNVGPYEIASSQLNAEFVNVTNTLPANGGRDSESINEIIRRAPSVLTSRDRAVTRLDFEVIAKQSSAEVARAACGGAMTDDGEVEVVILPQRREDEVIPDPFLSAGLKDHVQRYLSKRCLINVQPIVRLATFQPVDVSVTLRLRPNTNFVAVRDHAEAWVRRFLDPYKGGLDGDGWPFKGPLFAQDFARIVTDLPDIRHVVEVAVYAIAPDRTDTAPGWEQGEGSDLLTQDRHDLFVIRHVRILSEEA
ncbi:MAG: baseplate J/gp47 family protein [Myxococcota bacterium]